MCVCVCVCVCVCDLIKAGQHRLLAGAVLMERRAQSEGRQIRTKATEKWRIRVVPLFAKTLWVLSGLPVAEECW
jgi:hypothetical protein